MTDYINESMSRYIHLSKYSRWLPEKKRRETWEETVDRLITFWKKRVGDKIPNATFEELREAIINKEVMPSMRSLMTAGLALERDEVAGFNCAAIGVDNVRVFDEIFYLLMNGCGVGFSVESKYISKLPEVAEDFYESTTMIRVKDSKIGWAKALKELISLLYNGNVPTWDMSAVRPAGSRLKTLGGRASGPEPLDKLFRVVVDLFKDAAGRKLNSLEVHDLICWIAMTVIVGSVRRSACISLSDLHDDLMRRAKMGSWYYADPQRALANNSVAYKGRPDISSFAKEFGSMYTSKAGERGVINKKALKAKAEECGREHNGDYLPNPCVEAILRDTGGVCNLSEVIIRESDTYLEIEKKVRLATILGTIQSTLTNFRYLRKVWSENQKEERLLGVSFTGIMDNRVMSGREDGYWDSSFWDHWSDGGYIGLREVLTALRDKAKQVNREYAEMLGINPSKQIGLIKPSGTVSQLCGTSSGIHPRYAPYYLRRVTQDEKDPLTKKMIDQGIPYKEVLGSYKVVFSFPVKSPEASICAKDMGAIAQLELWKTYREYWCDGNPSQTIYYTDEDFFEVQAWVYKNFDIIGGLSFFPFDDFIYDEDTQPYLPVTEEVYLKHLEEFPKDIDWNMEGYEAEDNTTSSQEVACAGGACEM